jgi:hypothetical protein
MPVDEGVAGGVDEVGAGGSEPAWWPGWWPTPSVDQRDQYAPVAAGRIERDEAPEADRGQRQPGVGRPGVAGAPHQPECRGPAISAWGRSNASCIHEHRPLVALPNRSRRPQPVERQPRHDRREERQGLPHLVPVDAVHRTAASSRTSAQSLKALPNIQYAIADSGGRHSVNCRASASARRHRRCRPSSR